MNPCPCGYFGDTMRQCTCAPAAISTYQKRISGPLLDRIDIHLQVPRVDFQKLSEKRGGESSATIRERVETARQIQIKRFESTKLVSNADMTPKEIRQYCILDPAGEGLMKTAMRQLRLTARGYHRVLKLARTIADLAGEPPSKPNTSLKHSIPPKRRSVKQGFLLVHTFLCRAACAFQAAVKVSYRNIGLVL